MARRIPDGFADELAELEDLVDEVVDEAVDAAEAQIAAGEEPVFVAFRDDRELWAARPELRRRLPVALHRVALALALREVDGAKIVEQEQLRGHA